MTESNSVPTGRWQPWMHTAGVAYPTALWIFVIALTIGGPASFEIAIAGLVVLTVGTFAFVGGIGRYIATKK